MNEELFNELQKLLAYFPESYINRNLEVILIPKTNTYFSLKGVSSRRDIITKLFMWCSRDFAKTNPFKYQKLNRLFHLENSELLGKYLGKRFDPSQIYDIYQKLGNGINPELTYRFIDSGFDMEVLDD
ncbi:hypothetical protein [Streptococcus sp. Marseille-P7376]|uniref:hypothetical protein n=1 Tax=Streptococcus sp. Marseille-P7376 TaxID=2592044 RepID=UPI0011E79FD0|nr:hypothetical protein [Streptococcus sp. Marseille-P7376]